MLYLTRLQMLHGLEVMILMQTIAEPFEQKSIHSPFLINQVRNVHRTKGARSKLLHLDHTGIVVNLEV